VSKEETPRKRPNAPWYVKVLVFAHLFCITVWALPAPPATLMNGQVKPVGSDYILLWNQKGPKQWRPLNAYLFTTGFWQYWDMFAPNPAQTDFWADAEVVYRDGKTRYYLYPRIYLLPIPSKYPNERFRKFFERANSEDYAFLWPQFALRIAYLNDDPANPPVPVRLTRHWLPIAPPGQTQQKEYNRYTYYEYAVDQKALAEMRVSP